MTIEDLSGAGAPTPLQRSGRAAKDPRPTSTQGRPLWLMWPNLILLFVFIVIPFLVGVYISFLDLDQYTLRKFFQAPFIGFQNYVEAFTSAGLLHSIWVSLAFSLITTVVCIPIGLMAAMAVNTTFRGRGLVRSLFLVPYVIPSFVTATVWRFIFQPSGAANTVLHVFGLDGGQWLIGDRAFWV